MTNWMEKLWYGENVMGNGFEEELRVNWGTKFKKQAASYGKDL